ncbi:hypothetical protein E4T56_gene12430 [Termitomyces sp. T112]|nr:hypothetical protein E4T56_gene12430 [Termitomyces sp. T112]
MVNTVQTYKYLGVVFDPKLRWSAHIQKVTASAVWWTNQVSRLSRVSGGMPPHRIRQLYNMVAVLAFTYAADVWYTGVSDGTGGQRKTGSVAATWKLSSAQRKAAKTITGALSTTAGDVTKVHANLLPVDLLFQKVLTRAAVRLASLPPSHPLFKPVRTAARQYVKRHRSPLHNLFHFTGINPSTMETIEPTRRHPSYRPAFSFHIPPSKETALMAIQRAHDKSRTSVYCDGSGFKGGIGASAVLYIDGEEVTSLRYHLGSAAEHTVYEGEAVGFTLGLHLLSTLNRQLRGLTIMGSDSQAVIKALKNQRPHPAHHLLDKAHSAAEALHRKQGRLIHTTQCRAVQGTGREKDLRSRGIIKLQVHWAPGHLDFGLNERTDELTKEAAMGSSSPPHDLPVYLRTKPLPTSTTAVRQADLVASQVIWKRRWKKSTRSPFIRLLDHTLPSRSYLHLVSDLDRRRSALLTQLRDQSPQPAHTVRA